MIRVWLADLIGALSIGVTFYAVSLILYAIGA